MRAIAFSRYGSPDALRIVDVPKPTPAKGEVLVQVRASSINSWDWEFLNGVPFINRLMFGLLRPKPEKQILGADIAGTIEAVGPDVTRFQTGDEVFGDLWDHWGGFAEYACAPETSLEPKPVHSSFEEAAVIPQAGVLALQGIRKADSLRPGQRVLVNGAGGGVGTFAIQLAKLEGAEVTGVDAAHKLSVVRSAGADHVIDYTQVDFTRSGKRYDLILDCQNLRPMSDTKRAMTPNGTFAMVGGSRILPVLAQGLLSRVTGDARKYALVDEGPNKGLTDLKELVETGKLIPHIDQTFPLEDVPEAMRYFGAGRHTGKIAISVA